MILDNLSVHKRVEAREAIEAAGCQIRFLPTYSPDFNPIELVFSRLKAHLRKVGARSIDPLMKAIGMASTPSPPRMPVPASAMRGIGKCGDGCGLRSNESESR